MLLRWKGVSVLKMGNVANRRVPYQQFTDGGGEEDDDDGRQQGGARGAEERAHQDGQHLVWAVPGDAEEGCREVVPTHGCC